MSQPEPRPVHIQTRGGFAVVIPSRRYSLLDQHVNHLTAQGYVVVKREGGVVMMATHEDAMGDPDYAARVEAEAHATPSRSMYERAHEERTYDE